jgi:phosphopantothenoylcysteine decarboxylase/phosphopantothenate--cysteine ligase
MNQQMWSHPATQENVRTLIDRHVSVIGPASGDQACGETGPGRMVEPDEIVDAVVASFQSETLLGRHVIVTAGPTREVIDPVRFISNRSSGKMGFAVAAAAREAGADVTLVAGPVHLETPAGVTRIDVGSAEEMLGAVEAGIDQCDIFIATAAVADYRVQQVATDKIKKQQASLNLSLVRTPDILACVSSRPDPPFTVGFAAETSDLADHAQQKLRDKHLDMVAANLVGGDKGFDSDENELTLFWNGGQHPLSRKSKSKLARELIAVIGERYHANKDRAENT